MNIDKVFKKRFLLENELTYPTKEPNLPLVLEPLNSPSFENLLLAVKENADELKKEINTYGAILFRGFDLDTPDQFEKLISAMNIQLTDEYPLGTAIRKRVAENVFTTTEAAGDYTITTHTEMFYSPLRPRYLSFFCLVEPNMFGETPIFNNRAIFQDTPYDLQNRIREKKYKMIRRLPNQDAPEGPQDLLRSTWQAVLETESKEEAERKCKSLNTKCLWQKDGSLILETRVPGVYTHPATKEECLVLSASNWYPIVKELQMIRNRVSNKWKNLWLQILMLYKFGYKKDIVMKYGDDTPITTKEAKAAFKRIWAHSVVFKWKKGDVLLIDNILTSHSRLNVVQPRKILAAMGDMFKVEF